MYTYIETKTKSTNEVVKRMDVSSHHERVVMAFKNAIDNGLNFNEFTSQIQESAVPLEVGTLKN